MAIIGLYFVFLGCCSPKIAGVVKVVGDHYDPEPAEWWEGEGWAQPSLTKLQFIADFILSLCPLDSE